MKKYYLFCIVAMLFFLSNIDAEANERIVPIDKIWTISLSTAVDVNTVNKSTIKVVNDNNPSGTVDIKLSVSDDNREIYVKPNGTYAGGSYKLYISNGVKSKSGKSLTPKTFAFTVDKVCPIATDHTISKDYVVQVNSNGQGVQLGTCTTTKGVTYKEDLTYANTTDGYTYEYIAETAYYYIINVSGQPMFIAKNQAKKISTSTIPSPSYYKLTDTGFYQYAYVGSKTETILHIYAPDFIEKGKIYYSLDGITFTDESGKVVGTAINYFQNVSIRTKSMYSASQFNDYIAKNFPTESKLQGIGLSLINTQNKYNINALFLLAFAAHESDRGMNKFAQQFNNIYSLNIYDGDTTSEYFTSVSQNLDRLMENLNANYLTAGADYANGAIIGNGAHGLNARYATHPYWGAGIARWMNIIDSALGSKEKFKYELGIIDSEYNFINMRYTVGSNELYVHSPANGRAVTIIGELDSFHKVISDYQGNIPASVYGTKQYINKVKTY